MKSIRHNMPLVRLMRRNECVVKVYKADAGFKWEVLIDPNTKTRKRVIQSYQLTSKRLPMKIRLATDATARTVHGAVRRAKFEVDLFSS